MRVFISRALSEASPFRNILASQGIEVTGSPLVLLSPLPIETIPQCDWVFFSGKNAVKFFFQQIDKNSGNLDIQWAAIGPATAQELALYCPSVDFTGTGDPEETARLFKPVATGKTVLFPSARWSRESVQSHLSTVSNCITIKIYDNVLLPHPGPQSEDVLVFTSPMSAAAYFSVNQLLSGQQVIAIGKTTFAALVSLGIEQVSMAKEASESAMAEAVLACLGV